MEITCCDRCGKNVTNAWHQRINTNYVGSNGNMSCGCIMDIDTVASFDLCAECWEEFKKFIESNERRRDYYECNN